MEWKLPNGVLGDCTVRGVRKVYEEGVDVYVDYVKVGSRRIGAFRRSVHMEWLTRYNERKIRAFGSLEQLPGVGSDTEVREVEQISFSPRR